MFSFVVRGLFWAVNNGIPSVYVGTIADATFPANGQHTAPDVIDILLSCKETTNDFPLSRKTLDGGLKYSATLVLRTTFGLQYFGP